MNHRTRAVAILMALTAFAPAQMTAPAGANFFGDPSSTSTAPAPAQSGPLTETGTQDFAQVLVFNDGRQLRGALLALNPDEITWRRQDASEPLHFPRSEVRRILNDSASASGNEGGGNFFRRFFGRGGGNVTKALGDSVPATLKLTGGDWLFGHATSTNGQSFDIKLKDGTQFQVSRPQVEWLSFGNLSAPAFGFSGTALDMEGWLPASASMRLDGKTLVVDGANWIGHCVNNVKRLEISFELPQDSEEGTRLWVQPFMPQPNCYSTGTAELRFGRKQITRLLYYEKFERVTTDVPQEAADKSGPTKYRVFFDAVEKRVIVWRNGQSAGDWKFVENKDDVVRGNNGKIQINGICFDREDRGQGGKPLKFNFLRIEPWDGNLPKGGDDSLTQDQFVGAGATPALGKLESLQQKKLTFGGVEHPLGDGALVRLSGTVPGPLADADAKLEFGEQGEFAARNLKASDGKLLCETAFAPALELPLRSLHKIIFKTNAATSVTRTDMLVFKNGDELTGKLLAANTLGKIRWRTATEQEVEFQPERIAGVRFRSPEAENEEKPAAEAALLELRTGERWRAQLLTLDDKQLQLVHPVLGPLALERDRVWHLFPNPHLEISEGGHSPQRWFLNRPESVDGKRISKGPGAERWIYLDGTYLLRSDDTTNVYNTTERPGLSHTINPSLERFEVRLEARSSGQYPANFLLHLGDKNGGSLNATVSYSELELMVINPKARNQNRWREIPLEEKIGANSSTRAVRLFVDTKAGTCDIAVNGVVVARLGQSEAERLTKGAYSFRVQPYSNQSGPTILSNVWIGPWNGDLPFAANETSGATMLANGDVAAGTPKVIQAGKFKIDYEEGELELPLEKAFSVDFGGRQEKSEAAARIRLVDGSTVNLKTFQWDGQQLTGHSALWGDIRLPAEAIQELVLDPALPRVPTTVSNRRLAQKNPDEAGSKTPR